MPNNKNAAAAHPHAIRTPQQPRRGQGVLEKPAAFSPFSGPSSRSATATALSAADVAVAIITNSATLDTVVSAPVDAPGLAASIGVAGRTPSLLIGGSWAASGGYRGSG